MNDKWAVIEIEDTRDSYTHKKGCDRLAKARGMCKKHYLQWWHANSKDPENIEDY